MIHFLLLLACSSGFCQPAGPPGNDTIREEALNYTVNWPSGLSLGESKLTAKRAGGRWELEFALEAAVPGFEVNDMVRSIALDEFCSVEFEKQLKHGKRKAHERTTFDARRGVATRQTLGGGGKTEIPASPCSRDALAFLYFLRSELGQGRLPAAQTVFFGAQYRTGVQYRGAQRLVLNDAAVEADRLTVSLKGPASEHTFEIYFARDAVRTPLLIRVPLALGTFSMELVR